MVAPFPLPFPLLLCYAYPLHCMLRQSFLCISLCLFGLLLLSLSVLSSVSRRLCHCVAIGLAIWLSSVLLWPAQSSPILPVPVDDGRVIVESVA